VKIPTEFICISYSAHVFYFPGDVIISLGNLANVSFMHDLKWHVCQQVFTCYTEGKNQYDAI